MRLAASIYLFLSGVRRTIICNLLIRHRPLAVAGSCLEFFFGASGFLSPEVEEVSLDGPELPELLWLPELPLELLLSSLEESGVLLELVAVFFVFLEELFWESSQLSLSNSSEAAVWRL